MACFVGGALLTFLFWNAVPLIYSRPLLSTGHLWKRDFEQRFVVSKISSLNRLWHFKIFLSTAPASELGDP